MRSSLLYITALQLVCNVHGFSDVNNFVEQTGIVRYPLTGNRDALQKHLRRQQQTDLTSRKTGFFYTIDIQIGTPPQLVAVSFDTGSNELWVNPNCDKSSDPAFCKTFGAFGSSTSWNDMNQNATLKYGSGFADIKYGYDYVTVGSSKIKQQVFGVAQDSSVQTTGILGVGPSLKGWDSPYPYVLDNLKTQKFINSRAFSLDIRSIDSERGAVVFGGIDTKKFKGPLVRRSIIPPGSAPDGRTRYWALCDGISVENEGGTSKIDVLTVPQTFLFDSGYTLSKFPSAAFAQLLKAFPSAVKVDGNSGQYNVDCNVGNVKGTVDFKFGAATVRVPFADFIWKQPSYGVCTLGAIADDSFPVLGDSFLRAAYVVYDWDNRALHVAAAADCGSNLVAIGSGPDAVGVTEGDCGKTEPSSSTTTSVSTTTPSSSSTASSFSTASLSSIESLSSTTSSSSTASSNNSQSLTDIPDLTSTPASTIETTVSDSISGTTTSNSTSTFSLTDTSNSASILSSSTPISTETSISSSTSNASSTVDTTTMLSSASSQISASTLVSSSTLNSSIVSSPTGTSTSNSTSLSIGTLDPSHPLDSTHVPGSTGVSTTTISLGSSTAPVLTDSLTTGNHNGKFSNYTSIIMSTKTRVVTSCALTASDCSLGKVVTEIITSYTTWCPEETISAKITTNTAADTAVVTTTGANTAVVTTTGANTAAVTTTTVYIKPKYDEATLTIFIPKTYYCTRGQSGCEEGQELVTSHPATIVPITPAATPVAIPGCVDCKPKEPKIPSGGSGNGEAVVPASPAGDVDATLNPVEHAVTNQESTPVAPPNKPQTRPDATGPSNPGSSPTIVEGAAGRYVPGLAAAVGLLAIVV